MLKWNFPQPENWRENSLLKYWFCEQCCQAIGEQFDSDPRTVLSWWKSDSSVGTRTSVEMACLLSILPYNNTSKLLPNSSSPSIHFHKCSLNYSKLEEIPNSKLLPDTSFLFPDSRRRLFRFRLWSWDLIHSRIYCSRITLQDYWKLWELVWISRFRNSWLRISNQSALWIVQICLNGTSLFRTTLLIQSSLRDTKIKQSVTCSDIFFKIVNPSLMSASLGPPSLNSPLISAIAYL